MSRTVVPQFARLQFRVCVFMFRVLAWLQYVQYDPLQKQE